MRLKVSSLACASKHGAGETKPRAVTAGFWVTSNAVVLPWGRQAHPGAVRAGGHVDAAVEVGPDAEGVPGHPGMRLRSSSAASLFPAWSLLSPYDIKEASSACAFRASIMRRILLTDQMSGLSMPSLRTRCTTCCHAWVAYTW